MSKYNEPSAEDLAAIEKEWPRIQAELELLDLQIETMTGCGPVDEVTVRRLQRARAAVVAETLRWYRSQFNATRQSA